MRIAADSLIFATFNLDTQHIDTSVGNWVVLVRASKSLLASGAPEFDLRASESSADHRTRARVSE